MQLADITPELILAFLDHLEHERHNAVRSRNLRLTALRAFLKFAGRRDVTSLHDVERALAVPMKRFERPMLGFLTRRGDDRDARATGIKLVLAARPSAAGHALQHRRAGLGDHRGARGRRRPGRRGLRAFARQGTQARSVPLWTTTVVEIRAWLRLNPTLRGEAALLPNRDGRAM
jgi:hypothetical protein